MSKMGKKILPGLGMLEMVRERIKSVKNKQGEYLRKVHYGCYLLCSESGLRISEAVKFDLENKTKKGLYKIEKPKGKKERYVYISKKVIRELRKNNWKPNQTNRFAFYYFLKKIKHETSISKNIELTPHTLRRSFTTYHVEAGVPLPLLSKLLGHSSIRTTALYWKNIHSEDEAKDILLGKKWLEKSSLNFNKDKEKKPKPPLPEISDPPIKKNFPKRPQKNPDIVRNKATIDTEKPDNSLLTAGTEPKSAVVNYRTKPLTSEISPKKPEKFLPDDKPAGELLKIADKPTTSEETLLNRIKQLEEKLEKVQSENNRLKIEKEKTEQLVSQEKERADNYQQQLKTISKFVYQWQKISYYRQLEREAKVEQPFKPPPNFKK